MEFDGESMGSISRARGDLQQCRRVPYVSKNVLKRKSATLKKYGGKLENGGHFFIVMCGVIFCWLYVDDPVVFVILVWP